MKSNLKRFDIILVDFGDVTGSEQGGIRPALIIQNDIGNTCSGTTIVMPLTTNIYKNPNQPTHTLLRKGKDKGLKKDSMVLAECIRQISENRIIKYLGRISDEKEKNNIKRACYANFD